jgi:AcrR family transcriptional regulator
MASARRPRPRTRLARAERREQIIDAAAQVLDGRDPGEVTFEEIADAAGVSRALLYNYFGDRHGLVEAMYVRAVSELDRRLEEAAAPAAGRRAQIERIVRVHLDYAHANPILYRYAAGVVRFPRFAELQRVRLAAYTRTLGDSELARVLALGTGNATYQMVLGTLDLDARVRDRAAELITAFIDGGFEGVGASGVMAPAAAATPA